MKRLIMTALAVASLFISASATETYIVKFDSMDMLSNGGADRNYTTATYEELQRYIAEGNVEYFEPDFSISLFNGITAPSDAEWNLDMICADRAYTLGCQGQTVRVGIIDSGIYEHSALKGSLAAGYNYLDGTTDTSDNVGHGTFVSGIVESVAEGVTLVPLKCFDTDKEPLTRMIADAIYDAVDVYGCDVINMSFGIPESKITKTLELAVKYALQNGCILVASVGNDGDETVYYPANYDGVIGVGAVDKNGICSYFSQCNVSVDFVAPGEGLSGISIAGYADNSGTSFAAPHVSALAAVAKCVDSTVNADEFQSALITACKMSENYSYDYYYGHGIVNASGMLDSMLCGIDLFVSPPMRTDKGLYTVVYNNTQSAVDAIAVTAAYSGGFFSGAALYPLSILPSSVQRITCTTGDKIDITVWENLQTLRPLTLCRHFEEEEK